jgi:hypothetical protein
VTLLFVVAPTGAALAARIEVGGAAAIPYKGSDPEGAVTFLYDEIPTAGSHPIYTATVDEFRFASECGAGTVPGVIHIGHNKRFNYRGRGFVIRGTLVGGFLRPKVQGTAQVTAPGCDSDALSFTASPK